MGHHLVFFAHTLSIGSQSGAAVGYGRKRQQPFKPIYKPLRPLLLISPPLCWRREEEEEWLSMCYVVPKMGKTKKEPSCELAILRV